MSLDLVFDSKGKRTYKYYCWYLTWASIHYLLLHFWTKTWWDEKELQLGYFHCYLVYKMKKKVDSFYKKQAWVNVTLNFWSWEISFFVAHKEMAFKKKKFMAKQNPIRIINILELHIYFYDGHFKNIHSIKNCHSSQNFQQKTTLPKFVYLFSKDHQFKN